MIKKPLRKKVAATPARRVALKKATSKKHASKRATAKKVLNAKVTPKKIHRNIKKAVVPHKANDYRPHLVRRTGLAFVLVLVLALQLSPAVTDRLGNVLGWEADITQQQLLAGTNEQRLTANQPALQINQKLSAAATLKAQDMFNNQYWSHESPQGVGPWQWFNETGYEYSYAGENLARGFNTAPGVVTAWMDSDEHRENMLNSHYTDVGFAVIDGTLNGSDTNIIVAMYGTPQTTTMSTGVVLAANSPPANLLTRIGVGMQQLTPAALASMVLMFGVAATALLAHAYRKKLPTPLKRSWYRHHGMYKAVGMSSLVVVLVALYGGGQI